MDNHCNNQCMRVVQSATQIAEVLQARAANQNLHSKFSLMLNVVSMVYRVQQQNRNIMNLCERHGYALCMKGGMCCAFSTTDQSKQQFQSFTGHCRLSGDILQRGLLV